MVLFMVVTTHIRSYMMMIHDRSQKEHQQLNLSRSWDWLGTLQM
jgi:hypothetical protein